MKNAYVIFMIISFLSCKAMQTNDLDTELEYQKRYIEHIQEALKPFLEKHSFFKEGNPHELEVEIGLRVLRAAVQESYALRNKQAAFRYKRSDSRSSYSRAYESKS